jgi:hypothetical protein
MRRRITPNSSSLAVGGGPLLRQGHYKWRPTGGLLAGCRVLDPQALQFFRTRDTHTHIRPNRQRPSRPIPFKMPCGRTCMPQRTVPVMAWADRRHPPVGLSSFEPRLLKIASRGVSFRLGVNDTRGRRQQHPRRMFGVRRHEAKTAGVVAVLGYHASSAMC